MFLQKCSKPILKIGFRDLDYPHLKCNLSTVFCGFPPRQSQFTTSYRKVIASLVAENDFLNRFRAFR